ncbi:hypothetical protein BKA23_0540 [Rudaeicoccus suwonensis]|uniref:Uncharacterized protein n=1 Tax=Rudaeicoccus suwonensis TaxID=657409 RepID=A0A561E835_9MICO|nr:hypothetical protein BKA23_0540 [Rudaeicoccus suwonensis]
MTTHWPRRSTGYTATELIRPREPWKGVGCAPGAGVRTEPIDDDLLVIFLGYTDLKLDGESGWLVPLEVNLVRKGSCLLKRHVTEVDRNP